MKKKIQVLSNFCGTILGTNIQEIKCSDGGLAPIGCTIVAGENERVDVVMLDSKAAKLSVQELYQRCTMESTSVSVKIANDSTCTNK